jgi:hypothetical protein
MFCISYIRNLLFIYIVIVVDSHVKYYKTDIEKKYFLVFLKYNWKDIFISFVIRRKKFLTIFYC